MFSPRSPHQSRLLAALPSAVGERLFPHPEQVPMSLGEALYEPGTALRHVYFPTTAIASLTGVRQNGVAEESALGALAWCARHQAPVYADSRKHP